MAGDKSIAVGVIGASGYTGADAVRLLATHPHFDIAALTANTHAGEALADVFPHLAMLDAPPLQRAEDVNWSGVDAVICALPHGTAQDVIAQLPSDIKIVDMSADFRLDDVALYEEWYGRSHDAPDLLAGAVYGLTEHMRDAIAGARLVACPGCYPTATLLALLPLVAAGLVSCEELIIDAKSGVTGAGRGLKQQNMFAEAAEGIHAYGVAGHRHAPEIEQELAKRVGQAVTVNFTPHLVPMNRGELVTIYARTINARAADMRDALKAFYGDAGFVRVLPEGQVPATRYVRGSNYCQLAVFDDRIDGRVILMSAIDNLVKGSSGQAIQNLNAMFGFDEACGLMQQPLFP